jgi:octaprenyl-diphosphate synthase
MQQVHHRGNLELNEADYFAIIEGKTAELTAVSCRLGASYAGASEAVVHALERYGRDLGMAFQIADDVLDLCGEERVTGKSLGTDLEKQKLTLPVIYLLKLVEPEVGAKLRGLLAEAKADHRRLLRPYFDATGAIDRAWQCARQHVRQALDALDCVAESEAKLALKTLAQYVVRRTY